MHQEMPGEVEEIARQIVDGAYRLHSALGPGLLESAYQRCMEIELERRGLAFVAQRAMPISYGGAVIENAFKADLVVGGLVIVEIKAVESLLSVHTAQVLTYLRLTGMRLGLLMNFCAPLIKDGIRRIAL